MALTLASADFEDGDYLDAAHVLAEEYGFGCAGGNRSPHLAWSGAPEGTGSFAVTCYDPDAPTGSGFWHWVVVNIPAGATELASGAGSGSGLPDGALQTRTDFGAPGYIQLNFRQAFFEELVSKGLGNEGDVLVSRCSSGSK